MYLSVICFIIMAALNIWLVPVIGIPYGYMGSAWAALIGYFAVMILSWVIGRHYYPIPYDIKSIMVYTGFAALFYVAGLSLENVLPLWSCYCLRTLFLLIYLAIIAFNEKIPVITHFLRRITGKFSSYRTEG